MKGDKQKQNYIYIALYHASRCQKHFSTIKSFLKCRQCPITKEK